jgi:hypothetical protein
MNRSNAWECVRRRAEQEGDKQVIRDKIAEVFAAGDGEQELARRRFDREVRRQVETNYAPFQIRRKEGTLRASELAGIEPTPHAQGMSALGGGGVGGVGSPLSSSAGNTRSCAASLSAEQHPAPPQH